MRTPLPRVSRRGRVAVGVAVTLVALYVLLSWGVRVWTDWLWYTEVDYTQVFGKQLRTRWMLFGVFGGFMALWAAANLYLAYRLRPVLRPNSPEQVNLDRYRVMVTPRIGLYIGLAAGFVGLLTGLSAQSRWQQWLLFWNGQQFGEKDPQFGLDVGFFIFEYPFWRFLLGVAFTAVVVGVLGALFLHYLYGGVRLQGAGDRMTTGARAHLSALVGLFVLLKAVAYYLDRYGLMLEYNSGTELAGAGYADVNALLPAKEILVWISVIAAVAVMVFSNAVARNLVWPGMALALVAVSAIAIGGVYPWAVQTFEVRPNLVDKEADYIERNIDATRQAYGLEESVVRDPYPAQNVTPPSNLAEDEDSKRAVRLLDPGVVANTYTQLQQVRGFYDFNEKLDIDRYQQPDGSAKDYVVGVRELNSEKLSGSQTNWLNRHTVFTHGYGFVAAPANDPCGSQPRFVSGFLGDPQDNEDSQAARCAQPSDLFSVKRPQIYYGELITDYSVVGKPASVKDREFDRPTAAGEKGEQINSTYQGKGGVPVGSFGRRMLYAWQTGEVNFLLSERFNENSKLIYVRDPRDRVERVAPFLTVDGDPYPAVVDGRIVWIVDAYTTASTYPYSDAVNLQDAASDALSGQGTTVQQGREINYIRNSVKAVVDAYDGTVDLYEWDSKDPVLKAWDQAFDGVIKPKSSISEELQEHFRYPEDMFKVQRDLLVRYHVRDPKEFFSGQDFWKVPNDPINPDSGDSQPPFYLFANLSEERQGEHTFQLTSAVTPKGRQNLAALISGYYDGDKPKLLMLELPGDNAFKGPVQVQQQIRNFPAVTRDESLFKGGSQKPDFGNLLTLPVGDGLLYAQPLYIQGTHEDAYPLLQKVLLVYGDYVAYENNLDLAMQSLVDQAAGKAPAPEEPSGDEKPGGDNGQVTDKEVRDAVAKIQKALQDLREAKESGSHEAYGKALDELEKAISDFEKLTGTRPPIPSPSPTPKSNGSPSPGD